MVEVLGDLICDGSHFILDINIEMKGVMISCFCVS